LKIFCHCLPLGCVCVNRGWRILTNSGKVNKEGCERG
jgi:hypothetical protein